MLTFLLAEQMDVHEVTTTVREALRFSAYLRQPYTVPEKEKDEYVEEVLELLELQDLADAIVFSLGVEARKRLTIGVELASKPELLLFLDEPTSGLDAQSAWNIVRFLRKLADSGQAILCTIHQPSSLLFESFDRLLLLKSGGETVRAIPPFAYPLTESSLGVLWRYWRRCRYHPRLLRSPRCPLPRQRQSGGVHVGSHRRRSFATRWRS